MASETRQQSHHLNNLLTKPESFDFFQAIRLLKTLAPELKRLYHSNPALNFASSDITKIQKNGDELTLLLSFLGLTGQNGVLPDHFTETLLERINHKDDTLKVFLDIFNHHIADLFYAAWEKNHFQVKYELNPDSIYQEDPLRFLLALTGIKKQKNNSLIKDETLLYYSGLFANQTRSAEGLKQLLSDYFNRNIQIQSFDTERLPIPRDFQSQLKNTSNNQLGKTLVLGTHAWQVQQNFTILVELLFYQQLLDFLPIHSMIAMMKTLTEAFVGRDYRFKIKLMINKSQLPACQLKHQSPLQLGWNTCLKNKNTDDSCVYISISINPWIYNLTKRDIK